jgi:hypothetical protein
MSKPTLERPAGDITRGAKVFNDRCKTCHTVNKARMLLCMIMFSSFSMRHYMITGWRPQARPQSLWGGRSRDRTGGRVLVLCRKQESRCDCLLLDDDFIIILDCK